MPLGAGLSMGALRQPKLRSAPVTPIRIVIRSREPGDRRAGGLHPPGAQLVARVHGGAPAIGEPAARLHARTRRHPGARPADPRAVRPDGPFEVSIATWTTLPTRAPCCSTTAGAGRRPRSPSSGPRRSSPSCGGLPSGTA